jgi:2,4-dienoyl-CoA reductase-like NADH-dependent reductase (Old Yellow Enzyme family)
MTSLLQPLRLGSVTLPNRIVFGAHLTNFGVGNVFTERHLAYYGARAAGGAGLLVTEALTVHPLDWPYEHIPFGHTDAIVPSLRAVAETVRAAGTGTVVVAQLNHTGGQTSGRLLRQSPWAPGNMVDVASKRMARAMLPEEIAQVVAGFAAAARRCAAAGLAGVELNAGQWSLLRQFLSPLTNPRQDAYGGSLENRLRILQETVRAVRAALPKECVLGIKLCGDELAPWGGLTVQNAGEIAQHLLAANGAGGGVDYLSVEIGGPYSTHMTDAAMPTPQGHAAHLAEAVRGAIAGAIPVFAAGRIESLPVAESILAKGQADAVLMTRALISDPDLPHKAGLLAAGQETEPIRPHIGNTRYFSVRGDWNRPLGDLANPRAGREAILPPVARSASPQRVLVVGAGPAGLESAATLARQGHTVTLAERRPAIGGWARILAERVAARAEYRLLADYFTALLPRLGVTVELNRPVTGDEEGLSRYGTIYLAVGATTPASPLAQGALVPVLSARDLLAQPGPALPAPGGGRAVVLDSEGGFRMGNAVEVLLAAGHAVDVVTSDFFVGRELVESQDFQWFQRVATQPDGRGATFHPRTEALRWEGRHLICADRFSRQERALGPVALAVISSPEVPETALLERLRGRHPQVVTIGDARAPRLLGEAILNAHRTVVGGGEHR